MWLSVSAAVALRLRDRALGRLAIGQFGQCGVNCRGEGWFTVRGGDHVRLSDNVFVGKGTRFICREGQIVIGASTAIHHHAGIRVVGGKIIFGRKVVVAAYAVIKPGQRCIEVGDDVWIGQNSVVEGEVAIGHHTILGPYVHIVAGDHRFADRDRPIRQQGATSEPVKIGGDCWLGGGAFVTSGVTIGAGSVIGARSVVTRDIPAYSVAVGIPAEVIRQRG